MKINKIVYFLIAFIVVFAAATLNFSIKSPNDGALYYSAAEFFLENKIIVDPTRTFDDTVRAFPTTQIAIVLYLILLKFISQNYWLILYCIFFGFIWANLFNKLLYFSKKNFSRNNNLYIFLPLIIFFNYDYINSASSFYNELFYYPFLIYSFLKIHNSIEKNKSIFNKSFLLCTFLILGVAFRIQHMVLLGSLAIYFIYIKEFKNFFKVSIFIFASIAIIFILQKILSIADTTNIVNYVDGNPVLAGMDANWLDKFLQILINQISQLNIDLFLKNLKVQLALFTHFINIPKIIDYNLPNNFTNYQEIIYGLTALMVISSIILSFKNKRFHSFKIILIIYLFLTSTFLFLLSDHSSRYFLLVNFCILFFLFDYLDTFKFKINLKWFSVLSLAYLFVILYYGYNFYKNKGAQSKNTYNLNSILRDFNDHKLETYSSNSIFITRYRYNVYWVTKKPAYLVWEFFDLNFEISKDKNIKFYYIGDKRDLENYLDKIKKIEDFSFSNSKSQYFSIWRLYF